MSVRKYKNMTAKELSDEIQKAREELSETKYSVRSGKDKDYAQIKYEKRKIATMLTIANQKRGKSKQGKENSEAVKKEEEKPKKKKNEKKDKKKENSKQITAESKKTKVKKINDGDKKLKKKDKKKK